MLRRDLLKHLAATIVVVTTGCGSDSTETQAAGDQTPTDPGAGPRPASGSAPRASATRGGEAAEPEAPLTPTSSPDTSDRAFPQGLGSGDPRTDRVVLWTRVEPSGVDKATLDAIEVGYVLAEDEALTRIIARGTVKTTPEGDHTVRVIPVGLAADTRYYYRFEAAGVTTRVARTRTAPSPDAARAVKFVFASCQDFIGREYHAWRALLDEKLDLDFVLFLGDYIYETVNDKSFQSTSAKRNIAFPDGMDVSEAQDRSRIAARTLADYRALYKAYRGDAWLKEVHRLYPFVSIWDDHEFANDCWQDHSTYFNEKDPITGQKTDERNTPRRMAATRAWFEYQAADVPYDATQSFPDDIRIYRTLRFGKHVELVLTDQRSYRSDHVVPEGPVDLSVGKFQENSEVGSRVLVTKTGFDRLEARKRPTMLGARQKQWFLDAMKRSTATWKVWGNEVQVYQQALDLGQIDGIPDFIATTLYVSVDQWDGYRSERRELLEALRASGVRNLVVCTGDIHSFFASELRPDFDAPETPAMGVEFVTGSITSGTLGDILQRAVGSLDLPGPVLDLVVDNLDGALLRTNSHLRHADCNSHGFVVVRADGSTLDAEFVKTTRDVESESYTGVEDRARFRVAAGTPRLQAL